jgi:branched-chain amino acid transport system ATP-binding protein/neutral amino acid transport system ATP-binding protein
MTPPLPALSATEIAAGYGADDIIRAINIDVTPGEIFTVIGPNGSGKSTLIKALAGLVRVSGGEIRLGSSRVTKLSAAQRVSAGMAYVPQEFNVFPNMTIGDNIKVSTEFLSRERQATEDQRERVLAMFPELGGRLSFRAGLLSGGQRQMLAFACAMMSAPKLLLLDEPSAGLSPKLVGEIFDKILAVNAAGLTIFMIEQNVKEALRIGHRVMVLVNGSTRLIATPGEIGARHDLHKLFLG